MSKYSEFLNNKKLKGIQYFFGEDVKVSGGNHDTILKFTHCINENEIIVVTNNIKVLKGNYVLVVDNNKVVYLKEWQVQLLKNWELGINTYAVKLNRQYFKPYQFSFSFEDMNFEKEETFESLKSIAKEQDQEKISWKLGHYDCI